MTTQKGTGLALSLIVVTAFAGCGNATDSPTEELASQESALGAANDHTVLILSTTVVPDTSAGGDPTKSVEQEIAESLGYTVEVATPAVWAAKTTAEFSTYRAIILGEPNCATTTTPLAPAEGNTGAWGPAINGNVVVLGNDTTFHILSGLALPANPRLVTRTGIQFAASGKKTGAFISLSCYYTASPASTSVPVLGPFSTGGSFTVQGNLGCDGNMHNPGVGPAAFSVLTDPVLSFWYCSVHEGFNTFPSNFTTVAIDANHTSGPGVMVFPDESAGLPYIVAHAEPPTPPAPSCVEGVTSLTIADRTFVNANMSSGAFTLGVGATLNGNGDVAGNANLRNNARVTGTLRVQGSLSRQPGVVIGTLIHPTPVTVPALPTKSFSVGTGTRDINSSTTLNPGNFGNVRINGGTITLNPGTYNFASLTVNAGVTLVFSSSSATTINVQGALTFNQVRYTASNPSLISWYGNSSITVNSTQTPSFPGSILGPNGGVTIGPRNTINGCVQGRTVSIDADARVNGI